jgi:pimeloyl-ACP methyl ester carboxylesterase
VGVSASRTHERNYELSLRHGEPLAREEWEAVSAPTLVMSGEKSPAQLRKAAKALSEALPNARREVVESGG